MKTRLAASIGADAALAVYRRLAEHAVGCARAVEPPAALRIHFTPGGSGAGVRAWLGNADLYLPQDAGDLGERMRAAFESAFDEGFERVVILGSDLPGLSPELVERAFRLLDRHPAVIGPARDGGYYLLGLREPFPELFADVAWSTDTVLATTVARLGARDAEPAVLEILSDVDVADDLPPGWRAWAEARVAQGGVDR